MNNVIDKVELLTMTISDLEDRINTLIPSLDMQAVKNDKSKVLKKISKFFDKNDFKVEDYWYDSSIFMVLRIDLLTIRISYKSRKKDNRFKIEKVVIDDNLDKFNTIIEMFSGDEYDKNILNTYEYFKQNIPFLIYNNKNITFSLLFSKEFIYDCLKEIFTSEQAIKCKQEIEKIMKLYYEYQKNNKTE